MPANETILSPQSGVPNGRRTSMQLLEAAVQAQPDLVVLPPRLVEANGEALPLTTGRAFAIIQNCGTNAVKFLVDNTGDATAQNFHGVLAACLAQDDGLGSVQTFTAITGRVSIFGVGGNPRVCIFEARKSSDV